MTINDKPIANDDAYEYCTVVFRLIGGRADANRFIYALACRVEQMKYVEVVSLEMDDLRYQQQAATPSVVSACDSDANQQGDNHEQP